MADSQDNLTDRQRHEIDYHKTRADELASGEPRLSYEIVQAPRRRWWNAHWTAFTWLMRQDLRGTKALVAGCGLGDDAIYLAKLGAQVSAFDLSPDMISLARQLAQRQSADVRFDVMPVEDLAYADDTFDCVIVRDILHHAQVARAMSQIVRVAKPGATLLVDEVYTHSWLQRIRESRLVERAIYPRLRAFVYGGDKPYITPDERKLSQRDVALVARSLQGRRRRYFNFLADRLYPNRFVTLTKLDAAFLAACPLLGPLLGSRILLMGRIRK